MAESTKCGNCKGLGHYALDCPAEQKQNRCGKCEKPLAAGYVCGHCRADEPEQMQTIRVAQTMRRPWMRLSPKGELDIHPKHAALCAAYVAEPRYRSVRVFPPTAAFVQSESWRHLAEHPKVAVPCTCAKCAPPVAHEPAANVNPLELQLAQQVREFVQLLAQTDHAHRLEVDINGTGKLLMEYTPRAAPDSADGEHENNPTDA